MRTIDAMLLSCALAVSAFESARGGGVDMKELAAACPKCETMWVAEPDQNGKITVYRTGTPTECAGCKAAVEEYFKTGKFENTCKTCGALVACKIQQVNAPPMPPYPTELGNTVVGAKCQTVWVKQPRNTGIFTVYSSENRPICCSCEDLAMDMINRGRIADKCSACGIALMAGAPANALTAVALAR